MNFLPEALDKYVEAHTSPESPLLARINRETHREVLKPRMLSGHLQGRLLAMCSRMVRPECILEIGTYTGYSAICLAEGLRPDGKIYTIDINEELEDRVRGYFEDAGLTSQVEYLIGDARELVSALDITPDIVFIDADKRSYKQYYEMVIDKVKQGGFILVDNILWSGKVVGDFDDKDTENMRMFNQHIQHDDRVENVLFPIRDGLMVIRKL
jgi:predicted O-methyltransferase YrrM